MRGAGNELALHVRPLPAAPVPGRRFIYEPGVGAGVGWGAVTKATAALGLGVAAAGWGGQMEGGREGWGGTGARVLPCGGVGVFCLAPSSPSISDGGGERRGSEGRRSFSALRGGGLWQRHPRRQTDDPVWTERRFQ